MNLIGYQDKYPRQHPDAMILEGAWVIGEVLKSRPKAGSQVFLKSGQDSVTLTY